MAAMAASASSESSSTSSGSKSDLSKVSGKKTSFELNEKCVQIAFNLWV